MYRFIKVKGTDTLVPNPYAAPSSTPQFLGLRQKPVVPDSSSEGLSLIDFYEPVEQVVRLDNAGRAQVEAAIAKGELLCIGRCTAVTHDEAAKVMKAEKIKPEQGEKRSK